MDLAQLKVAHPAIRAGITRVLAEHGIKLVGSGATLDSGAGTLRFTIKCVVADMRDDRDRRTTPEAQLWKTRAAHYQLEPGWLGREFVMGGRTFKITGLRDTRGRNAVMVLRDDGSARVTSAESVRAFVLAGEKAAERPTVRPRVRRGARR